MSNPPSIPIATGEDVREEYPGHVLALLILTAEHHERWAAELRTFGYNDDVAKEYEEEAIAYRAHEQALAKLHSIPGLDEAIKSLQSMSSLTATINGPNSVSQSIDTVLKALGCVYK